MRLLKTVTLVSAALLVVSCSKDQGSDEQPVAAARLPEDLCQQVPSAVVQRWSLTEQDHQTTHSETRDQATCTMAGRRTGAPVTLTVRATTFGDDGGSSADSRVTQALATACEDLVTERRGTERVENRCTWVAPGVPRAQRGEAVDISRNLAVLATVAVEMEHHGQSWSQVGPEVVNLALVLGSDGLTG